MSIKNKFKPIPKEKSELDELDFLSKGNISCYLPYILTAAILILLYIFVDPTSLGFDTLKSGEWLIIFGICTCFIIAVVGYSIKKLNYKQSIFLILVAGFILRFGYIIYTDIYTRQHDVENLNSNGHLAYIMYIYTHWQLAPKYDWQFSHPPFYYFVTAVFYKLSTLLNFTQNRIFEGFQILTVFYSCVCMFVFYKILHEFKDSLTKIAIIISLALIAFNPTFILLSGSINNDILAITFYSIGLLYCIRWYKKPGFKNVIIMALALGFGTMTKLSILSLAPVIAVVFLLKLFEGSNKIKDKILNATLWKQFFTFATISIPLALWYPLRNLITFKLPLGYIASLGNDSNQYRGTVSLFDRIINIPLNDLFNNLYLSPAKDYNIPEYIIKCSIFGEFSYNGCDTIARIFTAVNIAVIIIFLISMVYIVFFDKDKSTKFLSILLGVNFIVQVVLYLSFNLKIPFACSMDFRYMVPTLFSGAGFICLAISRLSKLNSFRARILQIGIIVFLVAYCVCSFLFFVSIR